MWEMKGRMTRVYLCRISLPKPGVTDIQLFPTTYRQLSPTITFGSFALHAVNCFNGVHPSIYN